MNVQELDNLIRLRRSAKTSNMNGEPISDEVIMELIELATWAPTHAHTEPWFFVVYAGGKVQQFCRDHAELYRSHTPPEKFSNATYEKLDTMGSAASHVIALCMKRGDNPNIPEQEELVATACAAQNILLSAAARKLAVFWSTGGRTYHPAMKEYLGLAEADRVLGFLYLGQAERSLAEGRRLHAVAGKVRWIG